MADSEASEVARDDSFRPDILSVCSFALSHKVTPIQYVICLLANATYKVVCYLKPNSITLAVSALVRSWFGAGSKLVRAEIWPII